MTYKGIKMYPPLEITGAMPPLEGRVVEVRGILNGRWKDNVIFYLSKRRSGISSTH